MVTDTADSLGKARCKVQAYRRAGGRVAAPRREGLGKALLGKLYQGRGWTRQVTEGHSHPSWCPLSSPHLCCSLGTGSFLHHPLSSTSLPSVVANGCSPQAHSPDAATPSPSCLALLFSLTSHANPHLAGKTIEQNLAFSRPRCSVRTSSISLSINQK